MWGGKLRFWILIILIFGANTSQARVFSFANETMAPYVNLRGGWSSIGHQPYRWQNITSYSGDAVDLTYGGEFGFYLRGSTFGLALGLSVDTFDPVTAGVGATAAGAMYNVQTEGVSYGPHLRLDYQFSQMPTSLWKFAVGGGFKIAKIDNTYSFTAIGQTVSDRPTATETYTMQSPFATIGIGREFLLSGTTTVEILAGYHMSFSKEWKYKGGGTSLAGAYTDGETVTLENDVAKSIDWSYAFLQLSFQFYVDSFR